MLEKVCIQNSTPQNENIKIQLSSKNCNSHTEFFIEAEMHAIQPGEEGAHCLLYLLIPQPSQTQCNKGQLSGCSALRQPPRSFQQCIITCAQRSTSQMLFSTSPTKQSPVLLLCLPRIVFQREIPNHLVSSAFN